MSKGREQCDSSSGSAKVTAKTTKRSGVSTSLETNPNDRTLVSKASARDEARRVPVDFRYDSLNWDFLKCMAQIAYYAGKKYGKPEQYIGSRLVEDRGPVNHIAEHLRQYLTGEEHDYFGDPRFHLAAIAYNAMMEFYYHTTQGQAVSPLVVGCQAGASDATRGALAPARGVGTDA